MIRYKAYLITMTQVMAVMSLCLFNASPGFSSLCNISLQTQYNQVDVSKVEKGHAFMALVTIKPIDGEQPFTVYGVSLDVLYDPQYLEVIDAQPVDDEFFPKVVEGGALSENGTKETLLLSGLVDDQRGRLTIGLARKGGVNGTIVDQEGVLLSVSFRALASTPEQNSTSLRFGLASLRGDESQIIDVGAWHGNQLQVVDLLVAKLDVNDDEIIDLKDLILAIQIPAGKALDQIIHPEADFSGDHKIGLAEATGIMQVLAGSRQKP